MFYGCARCLCVAALTRSSRGPVEGQEKKDLAGCVVDKYPCAGRHLVAPALDLVTPR